MTVAAAEPLPLVLEVEELGWTVSEGFEEPLNTAAFAVRVGDMDTLAALAREREDVRRRRAGFMVVGGTMIALSGLPWFMEDYREVAELTPDDLGPDVPVSEARDYTRAVLEADRGWAGAFIAGGGLMIAVSGSILWRGLEERQTAPENYYSQPSALALVDAYNARLRPPERSVVPPVEAGLLLPTGTGPLELTGVAGGW